jgi:hypothetical protein
METTLRNLPVPQRVLFTTFLLMIGLGYLSAMVLLYFVDVEPHAASGQGLVAGIAEKYHGVPTRLEAALRGPMADRIGPVEKETVFSWIRNGATADTFETVKPIIDENCVSCHNPTSGVKRPSGEPVPSFETYDEIVDAYLIDIDTGLSFAQLARVSHIHLFGISLLFVITGYIISLSATPAWFRVLLIVTPYLAIAGDVSAWWLSKWEALFAWVVVIGGALMGLALAAQILIAIWEMWLGKASSGRHEAGPAFR